MPIARLQRQGTALPVLLGPVWRAPAFCAQRCWMLPVSASAVVPAGLLQLPVVLLPLLQHPRLCVRVNLQDAAAAGKWGAAGCAGLTRSGGDEGAWREVWRPRSGQESSCLGDCLMPGGTLLQLTRLTAAGCGCLCQPMPTAQAGSSPLLHSPSTSRSMSITASGSTLESLAMEKAVGRVARGAGAGAVGPAPAPSSAACAARCAFL